MKIKRVGRMLLFMIFLTVGCHSTHKDDIATHEPLVPAGQVEIIIDSMGIPHVYGGTDRDAFFGYGYQLASDRMFQLQMFRRQALGRSAEILGEAGMLRDQQARIFNWRDWGRLDAQWMRDNEAERYALIQAYVAGINHRIEAVRSGAVDRPVGLSANEYDFLPEDWTADDVYVVQKMAAFALDLTIEFEIFMTFAHRLFGQVLDGVELLKPIRQAYGLSHTERDGLAANPPMEGPSFRPPAMGEMALGGILELARGLSSLRALGSNNWAVDGRFTDTGTPYLAGDPHMRFEYSGLIYAIHINSAASHGRYDVAGFAFVGAPGIAMGHNRHVIWSPTSNLGDVMDMWEVAITPEGAQVGDTIVPIHEREEVFMVRGSGEPAGDGTEVTIHVQDVPGYGVIIPPAKIGSPIPIATGIKEAMVGWTGFTQRSARYFLELNDVESIDEFEAAVLRMGEMSYNFVGADATGIRYRVGLEVPKREQIAPTREPWRLMDGSDPKALWTGEMISQARRPRSEGFDRGFIATANTDPYGFTADGDVTNDPFYWGAFYAPGWRLGRIEAELTRLIEEGPVTLEHMMLLQNDTHSSLADDLMPMLEIAWDRASTVPNLAEFRDDPDLGALMDLLRNWDRRMVRDSSSALVFNAYAHLLTETVLQDDLPLLYDIVMDLHSVYLIKVATLALQDGFSSADHIIQGGVDFVMLTALQRTADFLKDRYDTILPATYRYGDLHQISFDGAFGMGLSLPQASADGGVTTINVAPGRFYDANGPADAWVTDWIPMNRLVGTFDTGGTPKIFINFPLGNVAEPESPHTNDRMEDWLEGRYKELLFDREAIVADGQRTITLKTNLSVAK